VTGGPGQTEGRTRIGVAIPVPAPLGPELEGWRASFGDPQAGSVPAHITLLPPTEVDDAELPGIEAHLAAAAAGVEPFTIHLRGTGTFRPVSPVVFVALASGISGCETLEKRVRRGPLARDVEFPYHPHVTVAHDLPDAVLDEAYAALAHLDASWTCGVFDLYVHDPDDGRWNVRAEYRLG
jgi:2'-5' RNA ligase